jgi:hypothetical protein
MKARVWQLQYPAAFPGPNNPPPTTDVCSLNWLVIASGECHVTTFTDCCSETD